MALTYHSFGQFVLYGWGYEDSYPPNKDQLHAMGKVGALAMEKANGGSNYTVGGAAAEMYAAAGLFMHLIICVFIISKHYLLLPRFVIAWIVYLFTFTLQM